MRKTLMFILCLSMIMMSACSKKDEPFDASNEAYPFYEAFMILMNNHTGLISEETLYVGVDLLDLDEPYRHKVVQAIQGYCDEHNYELLFGTLYDLIDEGYIEADPVMVNWPRYFINGIHFNIKSVDFSPEEISFTARIWAGNTGATGGQFRANLEDDLWKTIRLTHWIA